MMMQYFKEWSGFMGREMEFKVYGTGGVPVLAFSRQGGRFYEWEDQGMVAAVSGLLDSGRVQLFCADSVGGETQPPPDGIASRKRLEMQEKWYNYITRELYPRIVALNGGTAAGKVLTAGTDLGASQALNCFLRRPDLFCGAICLSVLYDISMILGAAPDDLLYRNSPVRYLPDLGEDEDDPVLERCRAGKVFLCCGGGYGEESTRVAQQELTALLTEKQIPVSADVWGADVSHDWYWWQKQLALILPQAAQA